MNTLHKLKIFAVILARKGKTILVYTLLCDDLTLLLGTCIMNCYMTVGIKEKERK